MTFKDLQKLVQSQSSPEHNRLLERLRDKPFWIWDSYQHKQEDIKTKGDCCFNHIIGLPVKDIIEKPLFDYEKLVYDSLLIPDFYNPLQHTFKLKHLWVKKATGLGGTEFFLRFMAWLCLRNNDYRNSQMCIVTGQPNPYLLFSLAPILLHICFHMLLVIMPETSASSSAGNRLSKQYRCSECSKPFDSAETLNSHQRFEHSEPDHSKPVAGVG
jgi:hypothetical protein